MVKAKMTLKNEYIKKRKFRALILDRGLSYQYMWNVVHDPKLLPSTEYISQLSDIVPPGDWFVSGDVDDEDLLVDR